MRRKHAFQFKKFLNSNVFIVAGLVILILLMTNWGRTLSRDYFVKREIKKLEAEVARLEAEQERLIQLRDFFQSPFFIEQESRKSLGYAKPGEKVVVIEKDEKSTETGEQDRNFSNPQKWWRYFFEHDNNI